MLYFFTRPFTEGESWAYKMKPVSFLFAFGLLAATKTSLKKNDKYYCTCNILIQTLAGDLKEYLIDFQEDSIKSWYQGWKYDIQYLKTGFG